MVGGLLMTLAAVGTFVAWHRSTQEPGSSYVVAARPLAPGERLDVGDLRLVPMRLPSDVAAGAVGSIEAAAGHVVLGPLGESDLVQRSQLAGDGHGAALAEVSFSLPRDRAVDGRLRSGDWVDVFVTDGEATRAALEGVRVVKVVDGSGPGAGGGVTVTLGLEDPATRAGLIHAVQVAEVTLVRATLARAEELG